MELLHAAGITQALLLAVYFGQRHFTQRQSGDLYEGLLLGTVALTIAFGYLYGSHEILNYPHLARFAFFFMAALGPLLLMAVRARARASNRLRLMTDGLFWLVPLGIMVYLLPFHLAPVEVKLQYLREDLVQIHFDCIVILYSALFNNLLAVGLAGAQLHQNARKILTILTDVPDKKSGREPNHTQASALFHFAPLIGLSVVGVVSAFDANLLNSGLFSGCLAVLIIARAYFLLFRSTPATADTIYPPAARYQKALLSREFVEQQGARIAAYLDDEHPFIEPDFQLSDLARHIECSAVQTSQIINRHFGRSFPQLLRDRRVALAKELLHTHPASSSVLDIALASGFNSKSAFNAAFKNATGETPSAFRKRQPAKKPRSVS